MYRYHCTTKYQNNKTLILCLSDEKAKLSAYPSAPHDRYYVKKRDKRSSNAHCNSCLYLYKARHAHKRLYTVLPKYSKIQVLPGITSCRLVKDNKQAIELNSLLLNNMPKDGYGGN